jgi:hypothetical protein
MLAIIWTNDLHGLLWRSITLAPGDPLLAWRSTPGPAYWAHAAYTYLLLLAGTALLFRALIRTPGLYRHQAGALVFGALVPWFSNGIYLSEPVSPPGANPVRVRCHRAVAELGALSVPPPGCGAHRPR